MLFKVAGYADAAKQQADAACVQLQATAAAGQAGDLPMMNLSMTCLQQQHDALKQLLCKGRQGGLHL